MLVWPGETVRGGLRFAHRCAGEHLYLLHCHMLEQENAGLMVHWRVV